MNFLKTSVCKSFNIHSLTETTTKMAVKKQKKEMEKILEKKKFEKNFEKTFFFILSMKKKTR